MTNDNHDRDIENEYRDGTDLPDELFEDAEDPTPWWREYAEMDLLATPDEVPDDKRTCTNEEDKAKSPYYPEVEPPKLPEEAREAGVERADLMPEGE